MRISDWSSDVCSSDLESWGLFAQNGGVIHSSAEITTAGQAGFGAFVDGAGFIDISGGSIETSGGPLNGTVGSFGVLSNGAGARIDVAAIPIGKSGQFAEIGRAQVRTPVTTTHIVCRILLEQKKYTNLLSLKHSTQTSH